MGAHCCKFVWKACKPEVRVQNKVSALFHIKDLEKLEAIARGKTEKLISYIKDRPAQLRTAALEVKSRVLLGVSTDPHIVKIGLVALIELTRMFKQYFVAVLFEVSYVIILNEGIDRYKYLIFPAIRQCCKLYPEEKMSIQENLYVELMKYWQTYLTAIEDHDVSVLNALTKLLRGSPIFNGETSEVWKDLLKIVIQRIFKDIYNDEDLKLLTTITRIMGSSSRSSRKFFQELTEILEAHGAWAKCGVLIFETVLSIRNEGELLATTEAFKWLISTLHQNAEKEEAALHAMSHCALKILKESDDFVPSFIYVETLKETLLNLVKREIEGWTEMISCWSEKSDPQSYARFFILLLTDEYTPAHLIIYKNIKRKLENMGPHFYAISAEIANQITQSMKERVNMFAIKGICYVLKLGYELKEKEKRVLNSTLFSIMDPNSIIYSAKKYKYAFIIWMSQVKQMTIDKLADFLYLINWLIRFSENTVDPNASWSAFLMLLFLLKHLANIFDLHNLTKVIKNYVDEYICREPYKFWLDDPTQFSEVIDFKRSLFSDADVDLINRYAQKIPAGTIPYEWLQNEIIYNIPNVRLDPETEGDRPDSARPFAVGVMDYTPSESELSSHFSSELTESQVIHHADVRLDILDPYSRQIAQQEDNFTRLLT